MKNECLNQQNPKKKKNFLFYLPNIHTNHTDKLSPEEHIYEILKKPNYIGWQKNKQTKILI